MGYQVRFSTGEKVTPYTYKTIDGAEKKAMEVYKATNRPTVVVDERYRRGKTGN